MRDETEIKNKIDKLVYTSNKAFAMKQLLMKSNTYDIEHINYLESINRTAQRNILALKWVLGYNYTSAIHTLRFDLETRTYYSGLEKLDLNKEGLSECLFPINKLC